MDIVLAPDTDRTITQLTLSFSACNALMAWAQAVQNTVLYPLDPTPDWFGAINTSLQNASSACGDFLDNAAPDVLSDVPQTLIDFGDLFIPTARQLATTVAAEGSHATAGQIAVIAGSIAQLQSLAETQRSGVAALQSEVAAFRATLKTQHDLLAADIAAAAKEIDADNAAITGFQDRIAALQNKLGIDTRAMSDYTKGAGKGAISLFGTMMVYLVATAATGGAAFPLIALAMGVISISGGGAEAEASSDSVQADLAALGELQVEMTVEEQQIAALQSVQATLQRLLDLNDDTHGGIGDMLPIWDDVLVRLAYVAEVLTQPNVNLSLVTGLTTLDTAADAWVTIVNVATNVQNSIVNPAPQIDLSPTSSVARATAARRSDGATMTAIAAEGAESLTPDVGGTENAVTLLTNAQMAILTYVAGLGRVPTQPIPWASPDGEASGSIDPLSSLPALEQLVAAAQAHNQTYIPTVLVPLAGWMNGTLRNYSQTFAANAQNIITMITEIGSGTPTAAQRQSISAWLDAITDGMETVGGGFDGFKSALTAYIAALEADHQALAGSGNQVTAAIPGIQQTFLNQEIQAAMGPGGSVVAGIIGNMGQTVVNDMTAAGTQLDAAPAAGDAARESAETMITLVATLRSKYNGSAAFVKAADDATFASAAQLLDLQAATSAWSQLSDYAFGKL